MFYYFLDGHSRSNLHVSLPIQDFIRLVRENWQSREPTMRKTPYRAQPNVTTQVQKRAPKGGGSKGRDHTTTHSTYTWSQPSNSWITTSQTNPWNRSLNPSQQFSDTVWQRNLKRRTDVPIDFDFMTVPEVFEFGNAEYDKTIDEYIMNILVNMTKKIHNSSILMTKSWCRRLRREWRSDVLQRRLVDDLRWNRSISLDDQTWTSWNVRQIDANSLSGKDDEQSIHRIIAYRIFRSWETRWTTLRFWSRIERVSEALCWRNTHTPLPDTCNLRIANGQRLRTYGLRTVGYELTDRRRRIHLYVDCVVCDADRPILSVVRLLESGWSIRLKGKQRLMVKDDVRIELTTSRGLLHVNPMHRISSERMTSPRTSELCITSTPINRRLYTSARFNEPIKTTGDLKMDI